MLRDYWVKHGLKFKIVVAQVVGLGRGHNARVDPAVINLFAPVNFSVARELARVNLPIKA